MKYSAESALRAPLRSAAPTGMPTVLDSANIVKLQTSTFVEFFPLTISQHRRTPKVINIIIMMARCYIETTAFGNVVYY